MGGSLLDNEANMRYDMYVELSIRIVIAHLGMLGFDRYASGLIASRGAGTHSR